MLPAPGALLSSFVERHVSLARQPPNKVDALVTVCSASACKLMQVFSPERERRRRTFTSWKLEVTPFFF